MHRAPLLVVLALSVALPGCGDTRPRPDAGPPTRDSGGGAGLPGAVTGLGSTSPDCVGFCRALFDVCSEVSTCFDDGGGCSPQRLSASACAAECANAAAFQAALAASGCTESHGAYAGCVANAAATTTCDVYDPDCGIEWGVYSSCAGL